MKKPTYLDLDKEMAKAFRDAESSGMALKPGVYSGMRDDILNEIEYRLAAAERLWTTKR